MFELTHIRIHISSSSLPLMILVSTEWQIFQSISLIFHLFRPESEERRPTFWAPDWKVCTSSRWEVCDRSDRRHSLGGKRIYTPANKDFSDQLYHPFIYCAFHVSWLQVMFALIWSCLEWSWGQDVGVCVCVDQSWSILSQIDLVNCTKQFCELQFLVYCRYEIFVEFCGKTC